MQIMMRCACCFLAALFYSITSNQPRRTILLSSLIAFMGYGIFELLNGTTLAYFFATLAISVLAEICARLTRTIATLYNVSALIPLVPGVGLYRTMRFIVERNLQMASQVGVETLMGIFAIALAISLSSVLFSNLRKNNDARERGEENP